jgi:glycosyltransferase involved in cell wall biosynthesis
LILHDYYIDNDKVKYYFCASDLLIQPYRSATNSGVSMVSYFYEKPVLVTNVGGLPEIVPHKKAGYVCGVNETSVAKAVIDFYTENRAIEFHKGVLEIKEKYSWPVFVKNVLALYYKANDRSNT